MRRVYNETTLPDAEIKTKVGLFKLKNPNICIRMQI
jgi:hypothetical protein